MSTLVLLEWSLSMFETVLQSEKLFPSIERLIHSASAKALNSGMSNLTLAEQNRQLPLPSRFDLAVTGIKQLAGRISSSSLNILNGSLQPESAVFGTFNSSPVLDNLSGSYGEFVDKLTVAVIQNSPATVSYAAMLQALRAYLPALKCPVCVIVFASSTENLTASFEFSSGITESVLPLFGDSSLFFAPVRRRQNDPVASSSTFRTMVARNGGNGDVIECNEEGVASMCTALYQPFLSTLVLGDVSGRVQVLPNPVTCRGGNNAFSGEIQFVGVMERSAMDKLHPSRAYHLLPAPNQSNMDPADLGLEPHFAPLIHATLKTMQGKVMLVKVAPQWYGFVETVEDAKTKKRSGLILNLFPPGPCIGPGYPPVMEDSVATASEEEEPSYAQRDFTPVWTSSEAVCTDLGKIVRLARRLPDKMDVFYKEVNKVRLHALSCCNMQLIMFLADLLTRESQILQTNSAGSAELAHAVGQIRIESQNDVCGSMTARDGRSFPLLTE